MLHGLAKLLNLATASLLSYRASIKFRLASFVARPQPSISSIKFLFTSQKY